MNLSAFQIELNRDLVWRLFLVLFAISIIVVSCDAAFASNNDVVGATLCRLVSNLSGGIARGIATIAIFAVGVGLFLGKLNWGIAAATAAGVGIIFSAPKLVAFLSGSDANSNCPTT
ncbi:MAG: TrbC/VirB2 family protein [Rickettsiaceae bacterium]|jgi:type IV secretory pathway VirB2 component (pilin)|nr:TrbC/VirB2 family protein [Alphaproteobacteria bacterium]MBN8523142.1 TrbC/VirB2 family protein [Rickettsiales bacterium]MCP5362930.1 TrbC/VirB2 family protein [Rickettsiaceae bacterium]WPX98290.1 Type IV secretion system protein VirB2 [Candidatus Megaera polyxenophila]MCP5375363.1 TrbC/VirB2 family protein [Rickettsiaceae bacterium]